MITSLKTFYTENAKVLADAHLAMYSVDGNTISTFKYAADADEFDKPFRTRTFDAETFCEIRDWCVRNGVDLVNEVEIPRENMSIVDLPKAPSGKKWTRNIMTNELVLEDEDTPYYCSVASETYWCS